VRPLGSRLVNVRQERQDRRRRDRAAAVVLRVAYPGVERLRLELNFEGDPRPPALQTHELYPSARAFSEFPCPYADCDGSFDLTDVVKAALSQAKPDARGELECPARALEITPHVSRADCISTASSACSISVMPEGNRHERL